MGSRLSYYQSSMDHSRFGTLGSCCGMVGVVHLGRPRDPSPQRRGARCDNEHCIRARNGLKPPKDLGLIHNLPESEDLIRLYRSKLSDSATRQSPFTLEISSPYRDLFRTTPSKGLNFGVSSEILNRYYSTLLQDLKEPVTIELSKHSDLRVLDVRWNPHFRIRVNARSSNEDPELALERLKKEYEGWFEKPIATGLLLRVNHLTKGQKAEMTEFSFCKAGQSG